MKKHIFFLLTNSILLLSLLTSCGGGGSGGSGGIIASEADNPPVSATGSVTLQWESPTTNTDGSSLTDLSGFKVYYGTSSGSYTSEIDVGNSTGAVISSLSPGTWCFSSTAYDMAGNESDYSNEICTVI